MANLVKTDIEGIINELNMSPEDVMYPIFETVVNSIQAIKERFGDVKQGKITVEVERDISQMDLFNKYENYPIKSITIKDNGIGFTVDNCHSFEYAHSTKKVSIGGKGIGRFAILSIFNTISIDSIINVNNANQRVRFGLTRKAGLTNPQYEDTTKPVCTTIVLNDLNPNFSKESSKYSHEKIADSVLSHCLLYYLNDDAPQIEIVENNMIINLSNQFSPKDFVKHTITETIKDKNFTWYFVKDVKANYHELCLCGHNRKVKGKHIDKIYPIFSSPAEDSGQMFYYKVYVVSPYLDSRVNMSRNEFNFPKVKNEEEAEQKEELDVNVQKLIIEKDIDEKTIEVIKSLFPGLVNDRIQTVQKKVCSFLSSDDGLEYRHLELNETFYASLSDNIDEKGLDDALHTYQYKKSKEARKKRDKLFKRDYSNKEDYQKLLKEVVDTTTQEGLSRLAQYVSHRKTIITLLEKYLNWSEENDNYEEEEVLHNLIYTMGGNQDTIPYDKHNLWLLDDRLTFHRYIYSDKIIKSHIPAEGSTSKKETDIAIYDTTYYYGEKNEYSEINSVVIFELKRPDRTVTYEEFSKQMREQILGVQEGNLKDYNKANVLVGKSTPVFYYYVVDANAYSMFLKNADFEGFRETPYKSLMRMNGCIYQEILTYRTLLINAQRRNKVFFKKLGIE